MEAAVAAVAAGGVDAPGGAGLFLFPFFIPDSIVVDIIAWPEDGMFFLLLILVTGGDRRCVSEMEVL